MDDGSTDNTPEVVRSFDDGRIRYVWQENKGLSGARNTGIRASSGEYVAFLDADDWFLPRKLELQTCFLNEHPEAGMVASGWIDTDEQGKALQTAEPWHGKPNLGLTECLMGVPVVPSAVLVRRHWLDAVGLFDESLGPVGDWDLWLRLVAGGCRFVWLPEILCYYRLHADNMSRDARRMREDRFAALDKFYARPNLSEDVRVIQRSVYAVAHVDSAARTYRARAVSEAGQDVVRAIELDPTLLRGNPCRLVERLVSWAGNPMLGDEAEYLDTLARHLPSQVPSASRQVRKAMSNRYMGQVFTAHGLGDWETVRACLARGLRLDPTWLRNRGVLSITARTFLPILRQDKITEASYYVT